MIKAISTAARMTVRTAGKAGKLLIRFWHFATRPETKDEASDRQKYGF
jgi:hypothetical protein